MLNFEKRFALMVLICAVIICFVWYFAGDSRTIIERPTSRVGVEEANLASAIGEFGATYGRFPLEPGNASNEVENAKLMAVLIDDTNDPLVMKENTEKHPFFETNTNRVSKPGFLDPWGHPYHIILNRGGKVMVGGKTITNEIAIWSDGPNGKNEFGQGDDIHNWEIR